VLIVFPSDPATLDAGAFLKEQAIAYDIIEIPDSLGYRTGATLGLYVPYHPDPQGLMLALSSAGIVIMRVFKGWQPS
jgi:hypothetical protein